MCRGEVEKEVSEFKEKLAMLGEFWDEAAQTYVKKSIPFEVTEPGAGFDVIGRGLALSEDKRKVRRSDAGRPTYAVWGQSEAGAAVSRWKLQVDRSIGTLIVGVMQVPFAPTAGFARMLATPAWMVTSDGEAVRTGPSRTPRSHEFETWENATWMDPETKLWEEGRTLNPAYRKPGCEMIVDTQTGQVAWLETERLARESDAAHLDGDVDPTTNLTTDNSDASAQRLATMFIEEFGEEQVAAAAWRWLAIADRQEEGEEWEAAYNRSLADGFYDKLLDMFPDPEPWPELSPEEEEALWEQKRAQLLAAVRKRREEIGVECEVERELTGEQEELCRCERLAQLDALKFGDRWFEALATDCAPSVVRLELNRQQRTLLVRVDDRPEAFLFRDVSPDARPFVNLYITGERVSLVD